MNIPRLLSLATLHHLFFFCTTPLNTNSHPTPTRTLTQLLRLRKLSPPLANSHPLLQTLTLTQLLRELSPNSCENSHPTLARTLTQLFAKTLTQLFAKTLTQLFARTLTQLFARTLTQLLREFSPNSCENSPPPLAKLSPNSLRC